MNHVENITYSNLKQIPELRHLQECTNIAYIKNEILEFFITIIISKFESQINDLSKIISLIKLCPPILDIIYNELNFNINMENLFKLLCNTDIEYFSTFLKDNKIIITFGETLTNMNVCCICLKESFELYKFSTSCEKKAIMSCVIYAITCLCIYII